MKVYMNDIEIFYENLGRKCIISEERFVLELPTSCALLATARPLVVILYCSVVCGYFKIPSFNWV